LNLHWYLFSFGFGNFLKINFLYGKSPKSPVYLTFSLFIVKYCWILIGTLLINYNHRTWVGVIQFTHLSIMVHSAATWTLHLYAVVWSENWMMTKNDFFVKKLSHKVEINFKLKLRLFNTIVRFYFFDIKYHTFVGWWFLGNYRLKWPKIGRT
jgi:hypothetical protein